MVFFFLTKIYWFGLFFFLKISQNIFTYTQHWEGWLHRSPPQVKYWGYIPLPSPPGPKPMLLTDPNPFENINSTAVLPHIQEELSFPSFPLNSFPYWEGVKLYLPPPNAKLSLPTSPSPHGESLKSKFLPPEMQSYIFPHTWKEFRFLLWNCKAILPHMGKDSSLLLPKCKAVLDHKSFPIYM